MRWWNEVLRMGVLRMKCWNEVLVVSVERVYAM
jgi:hypothetical protein